jgi:hypothetical protein
MADLKSSNGSSAMRKRLNEPFSNSNLSSLARSIAPLEDDSGSEMEEVKGSLDSNKHQANLIQNASLDYEA